MKIAYNLFIIGTSTFLIQGCNIDLIRASVQKNTKPELETIILEKEDRRTDSSDSNKNIIVFEESKTQKKILKPEVIKPTGTKKSDTNNNRSDRIHKTTKEKDKELKPLSKAEIISLARKKAKQFKIDPSLILGIIEKESSFNQFAVSSSGAKGLMQLMPIAIKHINLNSPVQVVEPFNASQNISGGTWYIQSIIHSYRAWPVEEQIKIGLAAYNAGPGTVRRAFDKAEKRSRKRRYLLKFKDIITDIPSHTINYVTKILKYKTKYES